MTSFKELTKKKELFTKAVTRPYPLLLISVLYEGIIKEENSQHFYPGISANSVQSVVGADIYYWSADVERLSKELFAFLSQEDNLAPLQQRFAEAEEELFQAAEGEDYPLFVQKMGRYTPALNIIYMQDNLFEELTSLLTAASDAETANHLMDVLNLPLKLNYYREEEYDLVTTDDLGAHVEKYAWLFSRYGSKDDYTFEQAEEKRSQINKEEYLAEFAANEEKIKGAISKAKSLLGEKGFFVDVMQWLVWFRTQRTDVIAKATFMFHDQYVKLGERFGLTYEQVLNMSTRETLAEEIPSAQELSDRSEGYAFYLDENNEYVFVNEEFEAAKAFMSDDFSGVTEITGTTASKGHVIGTVRILHGKDDFEKVQDGDVIVATMTTPVMVPAMGRAAAFVTDEGGITCHAAVISREMKKPCVIGTKIATQALKDGDRIEVDADNGVVRKV